MWAAPNAGRKSGKTARSRGGDGVQTMEHTGDRRQGRISALEVGPQVHVRVCDKDACTCQLLDPPRQVAMATLNEMPLKRHGRSYGRVEKALRVT